MYQIGAVWQESPGLLFVVSPPLYVFPFSPMPEAMFSMIYPTQWDSQQEKSAVNPTADIKVGLVATEQEHHRADHSGGPCEEHAEYQQYFLDYLCCF